MVNTTAEALAWMRRQHENPTQSWSGLCLSDVRQSLGLPGVSPSAEHAWNAAKYKHRVSGGAQCPRGTAVFWTNGGYGHVVLSVGGGMCWTNDFKRQGRIDLAKIDDITARWGQNFQGWTEDVNGYHYYDAPAKASTWASGPVYVSKLHVGSQDSDSVRRLQYRLMHHPDVPARDVRLNGNYGEGTRKAVQHWQREVWKVNAGSSDGKWLSNRQANALFGDKYTVHESK
jgi:hypothetical protein